MQAQIFGVHRCVSDYLISRCEEALAILCGQLAHAYGSELLHKMFEVSADGAADAAEHAQHILVSIALQIL